LAFEKGLELVSQVSAEVPDDLLGDAARLCQVLVNLLVNALKFTEEGEIVLGVNLRKRAKDRLWLEFSVRDTGIGIPKDKLRMIFESFTQVDSSTTRQFGGTGLGLTICAELVSLMGGEMWVESEVGSGSTFFFTARLELPNEEDGHQSPADDRQAVESSEPEPSRALRILIAKDNEVNRVLLLRLLEKRGHTVRAADNGKDALALVDTNTFDVALMDVQMPEMDGFETTAAIRQPPREEVRCLPIIAITAHAMKGFLESCIDAGMDDYVSKPIKRRGRARRNRSSRLGSRGVRSRYRRRDNRGVRLTSCGRH
jgi:CheY-like chemotaxis protein